jgi:hypothetical protein
VADGGPPAAFEPEPMAASRKAYPEPVPDMLVAPALLTRRAQGAVAAARVAAAPGAPPARSPDRR